MTSTTHPLPRRVLVTGGTSGLGLALLHEWRRRGATVAFVARHEAAVARVLRETAGQTPEAAARRYPDEIAQPPDSRTSALAARSFGSELPGTHGIVADVSRKGDIHRIALQALGALGGIDVLINNASSLGPVPLALLADTDCEALEDALATNLLGPFRLTRALLGALTASARAGRGAVVLNISSDAALTPYPGWGAYGASKAALHHLSRIWQQELAGSGVHLLSLDPGDMDTPLHALAVPDADPATLKRPAHAARELTDAIEAALRGEPA